MKTPDLNRSLIPQGDGPDTVLEDYGVTAGSTQVVFRNHSRVLRTLCEEADFVMGAVAWLTDENMINALATPKNGCAIVVQKEDFLRPDLGSSKGSWAQVLRGRYDRLRPPPARYELPGIAAGLNLCGDPSFDAIRCVGNRNSDKSPAFPRMHNKFLVFATRVPHARSSPEKVYIGDYDASYLPYAVWTGSFNLTHNATQSLENAVILRNEEIASAYANEWAQIFALSEPLDWENEWITPEYRVGT